MVIASLSMPEKRMSEEMMGATAVARSRRAVTGSRRDKPQLSCDSCRRRKLKCDRRNPCDACAKRGVGKSCHYPNAANSSESSSEVPMPHIRDRIEILESLVIQLMHGTMPSNSMQVESTDDTQASSLLDNLDNSNTCQPSLRTALDIKGKSDLGSVQIKASGMSYVDGSHWKAVLDSIAELKEHFEKEVENATNPAALEPLSATASSGPLLLYGFRQQCERDVILAMLPAQPVVDRLVSRYFNSFDMYPAVLHSTHFLDEYQRFWADPTRTPTVWLGLLFSVLCLAIQFQQTTIDHSSSPSGPTASCSRSETDLLVMTDKFREAVAQCLITVQYTKGGTYVLETMILYLTSEHFRAKDANLDIWFLLGDIVQLAMHMGYHRDPKHFPNVSPLAGEMRRRVWATVMELDIGISAQAGLPRLIKPYQADTQEPRNLFDRDFDRTTIVLPESRPESTMTPILYRLAKARITSVTGIIADFVADPRDHSYDDIVSLDDKLNRARNQLPEGLRWQCITQCIAEPAVTIMQKVFLEMLFLKTKIMLHWGPAIVKESSNSHATYLDAAIDLLNLQQTLAEETQLFGRLYEERWKVNSIVNHDILLATSVLCHHVQSMHFTGMGSADPIKLEEIKQKLRTSRIIWLQSSDKSGEAQKAADAITIVLSRFDDNSKTATAESQEQMHIDEWASSIAGNVSGTIDLSSFFSGRDLSYPFFEQPLFDD